MDHHTLFDSRNRQHKNYTVQEVKAARAKLYEAFAHEERAEGSILKALHSLRIDNPHVTASETLSPVIGGAMRREMASPDPVQNWIPRLNRFLGGDTEIRRVVESEPRLVNLGPIRLSADQAVQVAKCRGELKINDEVAILVDAMLDDKQVVLYVNNAEYAVVQALDRLDQRPTMVSATALLVCMDTEELILHRRSAVSRDFPGALHVFGGAYSPFYDHNSLVDAAIRETWEEARIAFDRRMISDMVLIHEKKNGFLELALLGIGVARKAVEDASPNPEGAPVRVNFYDLPAKLVESGSGGPITKVPLFAWLALGARASGEQATEVRFGGRSGQELFESIVG